MRAVAHAVNDDLASLFVSLDDATQPQQRDSSSAPRCTEQPHCKKLKADVAVG
jgi:hypothetical protein